MPSKARAGLIDRLAAFRWAIQSPAIQPVGLTPANDPSRMIRNGLMVVGFAALEDFLHTRTEELLAHISSSPTARFGTLPSMLQLATTEDVVGAFNFLMRQWRSTTPNDVQKKVQETAAAIASTGTSAMKLSAAGFTLGRANVSTDDVRRWLRIFGVKDGWRHLDRFAARIGLANPSLESAYGSALVRRNAAAHDPTADTQPTELQSFYRDGLAIGIGFDALSSRAGRLIAGRQDQDIDDGKLEEAHVRVRFIDQLASTWEERGEGRQKTYRSNDLGTLRTACEGRARRSHQFVVIRSMNKTPMDWTSMDVP